jgi:hypothetical protein
MTIFLVLNGIGVVFLLYVLANFWKEGHRDGHHDRNAHWWSAADFGMRDSADLVVITQRTSPEAEIGLSVIPFQARSRELSNRQVGTAGVCETSDSMLKQASAR